MRIRISVFISVNLWLLPKSNLTCKFCQFRRFWLSAKTFLPVEKEDA